MFRKLFGKKSVYERRHEIGLFWMQEFRAIVRYGPFSGLHLGGKYTWSSGDLAAKLFGVYEQEVLSELVRVSQGRATFIDIGAADGYYAVGAVKSGLFKKCIAIEKNEKSQSNIRLVAETNQVLGQLSVYGEVSTDDLLVISQEVKLDDVVMLIDIEGGEFDLLEEKVINQFRFSALIVEMHDWMVADGIRLREELLARLSVHHHIKIVTKAIRDLSGRVELAVKNDDHRWLVCSEGRGRQMEWLVCEPKRVPTDD